MQACRQVLISLFAALAPTALLAVDTGPPPAPRAAPDVLAAAREHIKAKRWAAAMGELQKVNAGDNADWNNLMGYVLRKQATPDLDGAQRHYDAALRINPRHIGALEYSGELALMRGNLPVAEERLAMLGRVCSSGCEEQELASRHGERTMAFKSALCTLISLLCAWALQSAAQAAEVKVLCAFGMQTVMEELGPQFERASGHKLALVFDTGGATIRRAGSEAADVVVAIREGINGLAKDGHSAEGSMLLIASTGISVAMRQGATKPDITSPEAFKQTLLKAKSITYLNPADGGASGIHFAKVLQQLGIADDMKPKTRFAPKASALAPMVASGEAEIGVLQYQLLLALPGIEIIGPLPGELQNTTVFAAALLARASNAPAANELLAFLRSAQASAVILAKGMEPILQ